MKRQTTQREKIFANNATNEGLISQTAHTTPYQNKQLYQKVGRKPKQTFLQRRPTDDQQAHERCSTLLLLETQIKITVRYHLTLVRMAITKKSLQIINAGEGVQKREPASPVGGNRRSCSHYARQLWRVLQKLKIEVPRDPASQLLGIYLEKTKTLI